MADNEPRIGADRLGGLPIPRRRPAESGGPSGERTRRRAPRADDPFDLDAALARLAALLARDDTEPRQFLPRGYYLNILV